MFIIKLCCKGDQPPPISTQPKYIKQKTQTKNKSQNLQRILQTPTSPIYSANAISEAIVGSKKNNRYQGESLNSQPNGNGQMHYSNGDFYRGEWSHGMRQGKGMYIYYQLNLQYEGDWVKDKYEGEGKLTSQNSSYYLGEFKNGLKHGKGQYFDFEKGKQFSEAYQYGELKQQKQIVLSRSHQEQFPTLNLDKERFNTNDLKAYQLKNPVLKQLDFSFLLKYFSLCHLLKLQCIEKSLREWNIKEVLELLDMIEMKNYKDIFYRNKIKGKDLLTIKENELKEDLKMKIGDRKKLLNLVKSLHELHTNNFPQTKQSKVSQRQNTKQKGMEKVTRRLSQGSIKNSLRSIKMDIYNQSILQQSLESKKSSKQFLNQRQNQEQEKAQHSHILQDQKYQTQQKCQQDFSSLQRLIEPRSQRSEEHSSSKRDLTRKNSKDFIQLNQGQNHHLNIIFNNATHHNINNQSEEINNFERYSQRQIKLPEDDNESDSSSSDSSEEIQKIKLKRKVTAQKGRLNLQSSQIRQLYDFLKEHRSLSFIIKQKDIQDIELVGEGGFGKVYKGKYIGQQIAIKDFLKTGKHHHKQDFMKQLQIISDLKHPNIVLYMGICITANKYTLITQYLQNGSLFDQLHKKKKKFTDAQKMSIGYDIVKGMVYLHNMKKILHRDLKSSNVLIGENWQVKLCDFGLSGQLKKSSKKKKNRIGTFQWMAPEVMRNQDKIDQYADVYSFGVIIWQLLNEKIPYQGLSEQQIIGLVGYDNQHSFQSPNQGPSFLNELMKNCLNRDSQQRPKFIQIQTNFEEEFTLLRQRSSNQYNS